MLLIMCPWCGPRAHIEFTYGGDATVDRPADPDAVSAEQWLDHVYLRDNPRGPHVEWWHHSAGCRGWFRVRRDTWTHRIHRSGPPAPTSARTSTGEPTPGRDGGSRRIGASDGRDARVHGEGDAAVVALRCDTRGVPAHGHGPEPGRTPMTRQTHRTERGGRIDRSAPLAFTFDGRRYTGYRGDTLASALLANGVRLVGRSFKYHRRRGIFGAGAEEPNALVRVGAGPRAEPNLKATRVALYDGLQAQSQNRWPSLGLDAGALINAASKLFPAGFYYKTFMWPGSWWMLYERFIRRAAGLGRAPLDPDPDHYDRRYAFCDVLVVGAGPAGLMAALTAARAGARVILVDDALAPGGSLAASTATIEQADPMAFVSRVREELASNAKVRVLDRTTAFGYYDDNMVVAVERRTGDAPAPAAHCVRQRVWWIRAGEVVLATGAIERPLPFENNDLPGVMLASAARTYALQHGVRLGDRAVLFTNNDSAYEALEPMLEAGTNVVAVVDARDGGPGEDALAVVRRFDPALGVGPRLAAACRAEGLILRPLPDGDMLGFSPPLIVTEADVEEMVARMKRAVDREVDALVPEGAWRPARP